MTTIISEDQLAIDWTLTEQDIHFIQKNTRGAVQRMSCAIDLCHLRSQARFPNPAEELPANVIHYVARQLHYDELITSSAAYQQSMHIRQKVIAHLGYKNFDIEEQEALKTWLISRTYAQIHDRKLLTHQAKEHLKGCKIVLPPPTSLGRLLAKAIKDALKDLYTHIVCAFSLEKVKVLDGFLEPQNTLLTALAEFKKYPGQPNAQEICTYMDYFEQLEQLAVLDTDLSKIHPDVVTYIAQMGKYYTAHDLKRILPENKRYAILICFFYETAKNILDLLVKMHAELLTTIHRKARHDTNAERIHLSSQSKGKLKEASDFIQKALDTQDQNTKLVDFVNRFNRVILLQSAKLCEAVDALENLGLTESVVSRLPYIRRYAKRFLHLKFEAAKGVKPLLKAIYILRQHHKGKKLPDTLPIGFIPKAWKKGLYDDAGAIKPNYWEMAVYYTIKKQLASGNLFLPQSTHHQYFWDTVYKTKEWQEDRSAKYAELSLPDTYGPIGAKLEQQFNEMVDLFSQSLGKFADIIKGELVLTKDDALPIHKDTKKLRHLIQAKMPRTRIEKLIAEADTLSGFSKAFTPFHGQDLALPQVSIYAALIAHATNMGLYGMGHCATGVSTEMIKTASQEYLRAETVAKASGIIINKHLRYPITKAFGDGLWSSSDGQRFGIQADSLLASYYPRFFGYYDRAISLYTHISDSFDVFSTQVISCSEREATYVLSGLLAACKTDLQPQLHCTDTHGFTEHIFALSYLLGFSFCPRFKDLKEQRLYKIHKSQNYGPLEPLFYGSLDISLIKDNWDQIVRIVAALKGGHIPAHIIIQKLANRNDNVAKAIRTLGRLVKTIYVLRYLSDEKLRYKVHLQLNRGESRHSLARAVFFVNQGIFKTNDYEEIMNKASCLSLASNAILLWNTHHMQDIVDTLKAQGHSDLVEKHLDRVSPLIFKHIQIHGTYDFEHLLARG